VDERVEGIRTIQCQIIGIMEHLNFVTFNGDQNLSAYKVIMLIKRLVDVLTKRSFKLDVSLMALWAVASWIHM
jgi:hypothetical protein